MANDTRNFVLDKGYDVSAAVTKYRAVKMTADQTVGPVSAVGDVVIGIAQDSVTAGEITKGKGCPVAVNGISAFECGATPCVAGNKLALGVAANGTLVPLGTAGAGTDVVGICVLGAAAGGRGTLRIMM